MSISAVPSQKPQLSPIARTFTPSYSLLSAPRSPPIRPRSDYRGGVYQSLSAKGYVRADGEWQNLPSLPMLETSQILKIQAALEKPFDLTIQGKTCTINLLKIINVLRKYCRKSEVSFMISDIHIYGSFASSLLLMDPAYINKVLKSLGIEERYDPDLFSPPHPASDIDIKLQLQGKIRFHPETGQEYRHYPNHIDLKNLKACLFAYLGKKFGSTEETEDAIWAEIYSHLFNDLVLSKPTDPIQTALFSLKESNADLFFSTSTCERRYILSTDSILLPIEAFFSNHGKSTLYPRSALGLSTAGFLDLLLGQFQFHDPITANSAMWPRYVWTCTKALRCATQTVPVESILYESYTQEDRLSLDTFNIYLVEDIKKQIEKHAARKPLLAAAFLLNTCFLLMGKKNISRATLFHILREIFSTNLLLSNSCGKLLIRLHKLLVGNIVNSDNISLETTQALLSIICYFLYFQPSTPPGIRVVCIQHAGKLHWHLLLEDTAIVLDIDLHASLQHLTTLKLSQENSRACFELFTSLYHPSDRNFPIQEEGLKGLLIDSSIVFEICAKLLQSDALFLNFLGLLLPISINGIPHKNKKELVERHILKIASLLNRESLSAFIPYLSTALDLSAIDRDWRFIKNLFLQTSSATAHALWHEQKTLYGAHPDFVQFSVDLVQSLTPSQPQEALRLLASIKRAIAPSHLIILTLSCLRALKKIPELTLEHQKWVIFGISSLHSTCASSQPLEELLTQFENENEQTIFLKLLEELLVANTTYALELWNQFLQKTLAADELLDPRLDAFWFTILLTNWNHNQTDCDTCLKQLSEGIKKGHLKRLLENYDESAARTAYTLYTSLITHTMSVQRYADTRKLLAEIMPLITHFRKDSDEALGYQKLLKTLLNCEHTSLKLSQKFHLLDLLFQNRISIPHHLMQFTILRLCKTEGAIAQIKNWVCNTHFFDDLSFGTLEAGMLRGLLEKLLQNSSESPEIVRTLEKRYATILAIRSLSSLTPEQIIGTLKLMGMHLKFTNANLT